MPLTELAIKNLKSKKSSYRKSDSGGLCLEISPSGGKLWRWRYHFNQKEQMLALGRTWGSEVAGMPVSDMAAYRLYASRTDFIFCLVGERWGR